MEDLCMGFQGLQFLIFPPFSSQKFSPTLLILLLLNFLHMNILKKNFTLTQKNPASYCLATSIFYNVRRRQEFSASNFNASKNFPRGNKKISCAMLRLKMKFFIVFKKRKDVGVLGGNFNGKIG